MGRNRYRLEDIVTKLRVVDVLTSQGQSVAEAIRSIGVMELAYKDVALEERATDNASIKTKNSVRIRLPVSRFKKFD